ncbi:MAG: hypothetical protein KatS3mg020_0491 [Fimbriimonadales bacterium]|nr:MAG: hypothetical protein KatS3mg020_0491 [Fimbriimonadales bacterium]
MPPQVVDYLYDPQTMRLRAVRFAVQPVSANNDPAYNTGNTQALGLGADMGIPLSEQTPQSFAFAWYAYDGAGRLTELRYYLASLRNQNQRWERMYNYTPLGGFFYLTDSGAPAYDEAGNRFRMNAIDEFGNLVRTETYQYDALDRLTGVSYNNGAWQTWSYDVMGNRFGQGNPAYDGLNRLTQFNGAAITHDLLGNRLQDGRYLYQWDALNRLVQMQAYLRSGRFTVVGDTWRFGYRADGLRVFKERVSAVSLEGAGVGTRTEYLYDGQMPVCEQDFQNGVLQQSRVHLLGGRGIEAVVAIDHTRGNQLSLRWLLYDGHGNLVRTMAPNYTLSAFQWRGVWGEVQGSLRTGRGYCANLGHPEDETGLVYMRARYYEPATGRFISEDPARDGVNWYLYADGNPVGKVDKDGKAADALLIIAVAGFILSLIANEIGTENPFYKSLKSMLAETARAISAVSLAIRLGASRDSKVAVVASVLFTGVGFVVAMAAYHQFTVALLLILTDLGIEDYPREILEREAGWRYLDRAGRIWDFFSQE